MRKLDRACGICQHTRTELYKSTSGFYSAFKWIMFAMVFLVSLYTFFILLLCNVFLFWYWFFLPFSTSSQTVWSLHWLDATFCGQHFLSKIRDSQITEVCLIKLSVLLVVSLDQTLHITYPLSHEIYPRYWNSICLAVIKNWQILTTLSVNVWR